MNYISKFRPVCHIKVIDCSPTIRLVTLDHRANEATNKRKKSSIYKKLKRNIFVRVVRKYSLIKYIYISIFLLEQTSIKHNKYYEKHKIITSGLNRRRIKKKQINC